VGNKKEANENAWNIPELQAAITLPGGENYKITISK
jgi:hypothetical protein